MNLPSERLQEEMEKYGFTEQEARVSLHLEKAEELLTELERERWPKSIGHLIWSETHTREHFKALRRLLAVRVLRRDYPEGWGYEPAKESDDE